MPRFSQRSEALMGLAMGPPPSTYPTCAVILSEDLMTVEELILDARLDRSKPMISKPTVTHRLMLLLGILDLVDIPLR